MATLPLPLEIEHSIVCDFLDAQSMLQYLCCCRKTSVLLTKIERNRLLFRMFDGSDSPHGSCAAHCPWLLDDFVRQCDQPAIESDEISNEHLLQWSVSTFALVCERVQALLPTDWRSLVRDLLKTSQYAKLLIFGNRFKDQIPLLQDLSVSLQFPYFDRDMLEDLMQQGMADFMIRLYAECNLEQVVFFWVAFMRALPKMDTIEYAIAAKNYEVAAWLTYFCRWRLVLNFRSINPTLIDAPLMLALSRVFPEEELKEFRGAIEELALNPGFQIDDQMGAYAAIVAESALGTIDLFSLVKSRNLADLALAFFTSEIPFDIINEGCARHGWIEGAIVAQQMFDLREWFVFNDFMEEDDDIVSPVPLEWCMDVAKFPSNIGEDSIYLAMASLRELFDPYASSSLLRFKHSDRLLEDQLRLHKHCTDTKVDLVLELLRGQHIGRLWKLKRFLRVPHLSKYDSRQLVEALWYLKGLISYKAARSAVKFIVGDEMYTMCVRAIRRLY